MAPADDPAGTFGGAVSDEVSPGASPRPTPPSAKRRRVEDEARAVFAPELPDEILHLIFSRVALEPRGGMPAVLAARATCRSWRRAASRPALWRDIALKRWGFCEEDERDETSSSIGADKNLLLCLRLANAPEAPVWYQRGRWHRAVNASKTFRVAFCDTREMRRDTFRRVETRTRRANKRARGVTSAPAYVTKEKPDAEKYSNALSSDSNAVGDPRLEPPFWRQKSAYSPDEHLTRVFSEREPSASITDKLDADEINRTAWHVARVENSDVDPGAVVFTDHLLIMHVRDVPWKRLSRNLTCGLACVAVDAEVTDDEDVEDEGTFARPSNAAAEIRHRRALSSAESVPLSAETREDTKKPKRWVRLCQVWLRVGVTLTRCGSNRNDARLFLDGNARFSHAAPSRFSRELFGDGDDYKRNLNEGYHPPQRPRGFSADFQLAELESLRAAYKAVDTTSFLSSETDADPAIGVVDVPRDVPHGVPPPSTGVTADDKLLRYIVPLEVANDARLAENDAREDVDAAAYASSALTALASEFVCAVSFTHDDELDAMRYDHRQHTPRHIMSIAPAVVAATLAVPRTFHGSPLATFRVGEGAAAEVARVFERKDFFFARNGLKCHLSFTHKSGVGYVYATALRADVLAIGGAAAPPPRPKGASKSPRAVHFSERHRHDAPHGTGGVFSASELEHDPALDGPTETPNDDVSAVDDSFEDFECRRWEGGPDSWTVTADVDPGSHGHGVLPLPNYNSANDLTTANPTGGPVPPTNILPVRHVNWTREPRDDARRRGYFSSAGFDTSAGIDRVETPRMIQMHEASVSVGHSLLITVPISALVAASGRAAARKTARETETR